jgi:hypothetical protein
VCGICKDHFRPTYIPQRTLTSFCSQYEFRMGVVISCPKSHSYCYCCMNMYLKGKLEDGRKGRKGFPVRCPECNGEEGGEGTVSDEDAERVLEVDDMVEWVCFCSSNPSLFISSFSTETASSKTSVNATRKFSTPTSSLLSYHNSSLYKVLLPQSRMQCTLRTTRHQRSRYDAHAS